MRTAVVPPRSDSKVSIALKLAIGAGAGVCLALVKLLEVNFYIGQPRAVVAGGLLAAAAFLLVGALFTAFGTDEHQTGKLFMQGLLARSLIIAIEHRGVDVPQQADTHPAIPTLGALTDIAIPVLFAAEPQQPPAAAPASVKTITREQVSPSGLDGALMLLGRTQASQSFLYVVGKTTNKAQAEKTAARLRDALGGQETINIVKSDNGPDLYVVVGSLQTANSAAASKQQVIAKVAGNPRADPQAVALLANGPVVDARSLVKGGSE